MNNNNNNIKIRLEKPEEYKEVENLVRESFWNVYRPGALEHYVLNQLRSDDNFVKELDFVILRDNKIIGQNVFLKTNIKLVDGKLLPILTMGPICIMPNLRGQGYGKLLLDYSLEEACKLGFGAVCFEGNIDFYGKSGFDYASNFNIKYHGVADGEDQSFFLCKELKKGYLDGISAEYSTPDVYLVSEKEADEFDKNFPYKEKSKIQGQIFN